MSGASVCASSRGQERVHCVRSAWAPTDVRQCTGVLNVGLWGRGEGGRVSVAKGQGFWKARCSGRCPCPPHVFCRLPSLCLCSAKGGACNSSFPFPRTDFWDLLVGRGCKEHLVQPAAPYRDLKPRSSLPVLGRQARGHLPAPSRWRPDTPLQGVPCFQLTPPKG